MSIKNLTEILKTSGYFAVVAASIITLAEYYEAKTGKSALDLIIRKEIKDE